MPRFPSTAVENGNACLVWSDNKDGDNDVYYIRGESLPIQSGQDELTFMEQYWWIILLLILVVVIGLVVLGILRKRPVEGKFFVEEETSLQKPEE